jgi:hypothetical protein
MMEDMIQFQALASHTQDIPARGMQGQARKPWIGSGPIALAQDNPSGGQPQRGDRHFGRERLQLAFDIEIDRNQQTLLFEDRARRVEVDRNLQSSCGGHVKTTVTPEMRWQRCIAQGLSRDLCTVLRTY